MLLLLLLLLLLLKPVGLKSEVVVGLKGLKGECSGEDRLKVLLEKEEEREEEEAGEEGR